MGRKFSGIVMNSNTSLFEMLLLGSAILAEMLQRHVVVEALLLLGLICDLSAEPSRNYHDTMRSHVCLQNQVIDQILLVAAALPQQTRDMLSMLLCYPWYHHHFKIIVDSVIISPASSPGNHHQAIITRLSPPKAFWPQSDSRVTDLAHTLHERR